MSEEYYNYSESQTSDYTFHQPVEPKKKGGFFKKLLGVIALGIVFGLAAGGAFYAVVRFTGVTAESEAVLGGEMEAAEIAEEPVYDEETQTDMNTDTEAAEEEFSESAGIMPLTEAPEGGNTVSKIVKDCRPYVVAITCHSVQEVQSFFGTQTYEAEGAGSGIIVDQNESELLVVTNNHVVAGATDLSVCFNDDADQTYQAAVKGTDSVNDLAVVAVSLSDLSDTTRDSIKVAPLGDSEKLEVGEQVVAIGNALGYGQSVTTGIVSALDREVRIDGGVSYLIQTDAAINPGNSGGALINMKGEVIGINSAKYSSEEVEGMGYAIPMSKAKDIIDTLKTKKTRREVPEAKRGYLGISARTVTEQAASMYNMPIGVYVYEVGEGGAAQKAGIEGGDVITYVDGTRVKSADNLIETLKYYSAGETIDVVIQRNERGGYVEQTVEVTLAPQVIKDDSETTDHHGNTEHHDDEHHEDSPFK